MLILLPASALLADFSYEQTSKVTGGAMAGMMKVAGVFSKKMREPVHTTIAVKGDRMVQTTADTASIIDLSKETITNVDFQRKTYSVMTFAEMKQMMDKLAAKNKKDANQPEMNFKVSANNTGQTKQIGGFDTKEMIVKMEMESTDQKNGQKGSMVITTDMWIAPKVAGYQEINDFYKRMSEKLSWTPGGNMFMSSPEVSKGMAEVYKEMAKVDGMPVAQVISMGGAGEQGQQAGGAPPQQQAEAPSGGGGLGGALGGKLGGFGGFGRRKKEPKQEQPAPAAQPASTSGGAPASL
ncbi:MAG: hypothetical protein M1541_08740, partial [Acidobacteria bacterium]|nr:hypothetical protein [Acidobacteriota bacterium]